MKHNIQQLKVNQQQGQKITLKKISAYFQQTLLELNTSPGNHGIFMFGAIKSGITTTCHYLLHSVLKGVSPNNLTNIQQPQMSKQKKGSMSTILKAQLKTKHTKQMHKFLETKLTRTTSSHSLLFHSQNQGQEEHEQKQVQSPTKTIYELAHIKKQQISKIGKWYGNSQSQKIVLHRIQLQLDQQIDNIYLIDCPGVMNEEWINNYYRNHMYHHLIFRKFTHLKFVIVFSYADMDRSAKLMLDTFAQFFMMFHIQMTFQEIINSICVIVTNVPQHFIGNLIHQYQLTSDRIKSVYRPYYLKLKKHLIQNNRIFAIQSPHLNQQSNLLNTTLSNVYNSIQYWSRESVEKLKSDVGKLEDCTEMKYITQKIPAFDPYDNSLDVRLLQMRNFYYEQIRKRLKDLAKIVGVLQIDCKKAESYQFYKILVQKSQKMAQQKHKQNPQHFSKTNQQKRTILKSQILKCSPLFTSSQSLQLSKKQLFWMNKIQAFGRLQQIAKSLCYNYKPIQLIRALKKVLLVIYTIAKTTAKMIGIDKEQKRLKIIQEWIYNVYIDNFLIFCWSLHCQAFDKAVSRSMKQNNQYAYYLMFQHQLDVHIALQTSMSFTYGEVITECIKQSKLPLQKWMEIIRNLSAFKLKKQSQQTTQNLKIIQQIQKIAEQMEQIKRKQ